MLTALVGTHSSEQWSGLMPREMERDGGGQRVRGGERERQRGRDSSPLISGQILFLHVSTQTVRAKPTHSRNRSRREERAKNLRRRQRDASEA